MSTRVLVTGGAGYIGSHTCKALAQAGYLPVTIDNFVYGHDWAVKWGPLETGDIGDPEFVERVIRQNRIEAVVHFAAYAYVGESMSEPATYFRNNVINSLCLLETMQSCGVRNIVFSSTCATYGLPEEVPIGEEHPQRPVNPYGESKLFLERTLNWYDTAYQLRSVVLRYFNAAGADPDGEIGEDHDPEMHLSPLAIAAALGQGPELRVFGNDYPTPDGTAVRDYVHVTDLASAHVKALDYLLRGGTSTALNLGTGTGRSVREVIAAVERASGRRVPVREAPRRPGDPPLLIAAPGQAREVLGWAPRMSDIDSIVTTALHWHSRKMSIQSPSMQVAVNS